MHRKMMPEVFEIPARRAGNLLPWFTALAMSAIVIGATLALVVKNDDAIGDPPQVTVGR